MEILVPFAAKSFASDRSTPEPFPEPAFIQGHVVVLVDLRATEP
jgi:hypothetical protein